MQSRLAFAVSEAESDWSYGRVFKSWSVVLRAELIGLKDLISRLHDFDQIVMDDFHAVEFTSRHPKLGATSRVVPYAQTLLGLNLLRQGKKRFAYRVAETIPFELIARNYALRLRNFDLVVANSIGTAKLLHQLYNIYPHRVAYPGIDESLFRATRPKKSQLLVYCSAPYLPWYNDPVDLEATRLVVREAKKRGWETHSFGQTISGVPELVQHPGVSTNDLIDLYSSSLVTLTPQMNELFGLVPVESMFCGTPVISTYLHEAVRAGHNGFVLNKKQAGIQLDHLASLEPPLVRDSVSRFSIDETAHAMGEILGDERGKFKSRS